MSEHAWVSEQIAAFVAGGLDAAESERVETHVRECALCDASMKDALALDRRMDSLFAAAKPGPALEDRAIRALRVPKAERASKSLRPGWKRKLAWCAAASVGLGLTGAGMSFVAGNGKLPFPGYLVDWEYTPQGQMQESIAGIIAGKDERPNLAVLDDASRSMEPTTDLYTSVQSGQIKSFGEIAKQRQYRDSAAAMDPEAMARNFREQTVNSTMSPSTQAPTTMLGDYDQSGSNRSESEKRTGVMRGEGTARGAIPMRDGTSNSIIFNDRPIDSRLGYFVGGGRPAGGASPPATGMQTQLGNWAKGNNGTFMGDSLAPPNGQAPGPGAVPASSTPPPAVDSSAQIPPPNWNDTTKLLKAFNPTEHKPKLEMLDMIKDVQDGQKNKKPESNNKSNDNSGPTKTVSATDEAPANPRRLVIRTGEIEFEIESFDSATATVIKLVNAIKGGYIGTVNSDKLANGKVKGSIVVRVPPEALDGLVLDLRRELGKGGELKGQRIGSQDITKQYTDIESRLKAARTMEERLLKIIKEGKGEIKQLLEAEKELGVGRTKIEEMEGEIRYYNNQVALSTLTITLAEKEIKSAAGITESERIQTGIEVEDVEKAHQALLAAVAEAKGRIIKSEMKQLSAGQYNATLDFECPPEKAGPLRDRLKQLGYTARLEIDRVQQTGDGKPVKDAKVTRGDTQFFVQLYNPANMATRESTDLTVAAQDVPSAYRSLRDAVAAAKGRVLKANLDENDRRNINAQLDFEVRRADEAAIQTALAAAGETISRKAARIPEGSNVTDAKVAYHLTLVGAARLNPRETHTLGIEVRDVDQTVNAFAAQVAEVKGEVLTADVGHERDGRVTARLIYNVPLSAAASLAERFQKAGTVRFQQVARDPQAHDGKLALARLDVTLSNAELIVPRDETLWTPIRKGLSWSVRVLLLSVSWVIVGLCVVLPWGLAGYGLYRLGRRLFYTPPPALAAPVPPATAS